MAKGDQIVSGIEEEEFAKLGMLDRSDQGGVAKSLGQPDGSDHMVEAVVRWSFRRNCASFGVDDDVEGVNADLAQHRPQQRGFVFAVAIAVREYLRCGMRLVAADAELDTDIADVALYEGARASAFFPRWWFSMQSTQRLVV